MKRISEWIQEREQRMQLVFSASEARSVFPDRDLQVLRNGLHRLVQAGRLEIVHRSIYVIVPPKYEQRGGLPPMFYMSSMMKILQRDYYFWLLTAARMWGASHQLSQVDTIMTTYPNMTASAERNVHASRCYRRTIPREFVCEIKGEYDRVRYSNAELTSLDLVQHASHTGGLSRVALVLSELVERRDFTVSDKTGLLDVTNVPTIQRLGYLLETVVGNQKQSDDLFMAFVRRFGRRHKYIPLDAHASADQSLRNERWRVLVDQELELDDL